MLCAFQFYRLANVDGVEQDAAQLILLFIDCIDVLSAPPDDLVSHEEIDNAKRGHCQKNSGATHVDKSTGDNQKLHAQRKANGHKKCQQLLICCYPTLN
ncbi:hypothetical protein D3C85_1333670 [compost metagenome]